MKYVVTGAAGFIGSQLAEKLLEGGHELVAIDCFTDYYDPALKEENAAGLDVTRVDLAEEDLDLDGVDGVFHLAGQPGVPAPVSPETWSAFQLSRITSSASESSPMNGAAPAARYLEKAARLRLSRPRASAAVTPARVRVGPSASSRPTRSAS